MTNPMTSVQAPALSVGARELLHLVRGQGPLTRAQIGTSTGWARVTVTARLDELQEHQLLRPAGLVSVARGRPATCYEFDPTRGRLLVADVGATRALVAQCDLAGEVLSRADVSLRIEDGPDVVLAQVIQTFESVRGSDETPAWGVGVGLPGPIEHPTGRVVSPPIMTGWNGLAVPGRLVEHFQCPIVVENDADAMAWGEYQHLANGHRAEQDPRINNLLFVKIGTGVGAGIVANGELVRGSDGAAGDLGHTYIDVADTPPPLCRCGNAGCVEAYCGGWAIVRDLAALGKDVATVADVLALMENGDAEARRHVRDAGRVLGAALASAVSLLNPAQVIVGGQLADAGQDLLAGVRERIAARSLPLATQGLAIRSSFLGREAGVLGLADAVAEAVFRGIDESRPV